jgi:hypothetical protein
LNLSTRIGGARWYGNTKQGEFMSEADAPSQAIQASYERAMKFLTAVGLTTEHKPPSAEIRWSNDGY